jgi:hypothetical protein
MDRADKLEHDPEKASPGLDPGWKPVFGRDHAQTKGLDHDPIQLNRIVIEDRSGRPANAIVACLDRSARRDRPSFMP